MFSKRQAEDLVNQNVIQKNVSPWSGPVNIVNIETD